MALQTRPLQPPYFAGRAVQPRLQPAIWWSFQRPRVPTPVPITPKATAVASASATITTFVPVQTNNSTMVVSAGTTGTVSFTSNVTAGNSIVVLLGWNTFTSAGTDLEPITVTDNHGNTYNVEVHEIGGPAFRGIGMAKADNVAAGATTITITANAVCYVGASLFELPPCLSMSANGQASGAATSGNYDTGYFIMLDGGVVVTALTTAEATSNPLNVSIPSGYTSLGGASAAPSGHNIGFSSAYAASPVPYGSYDVGWFLNEAMSVTSAAWCLVPVAELRPRLIQAVSQGSSSTTSVLTYSPGPLPNMAVQKGNRIIVAVGGNDGGGTVHNSWTVTDDQGNTYHKDTEIALPGSTYYTQVWSAIAAKSAQTTVTWGAGGATFARILAHEVFNASSGIDNVQTPSGTGSLITGSVNATINANEYPFAWLVHNAGLTGVDAPWVVIGNSSNELTVQYIPGATGTFSLTTPTGASDIWAANLISYYRSTSTVPNLTASASAVASASALVTAPTFVAPSATGVASASATVTTPSVPLLTPSATAVAGASAVVTAPALLTPSATAVAGSSANLTAPAILTPTATAVAAASTAVTAPANITPSATAVASASSTVTAPGVVFLTPTATAIAVAAVTLTAPATIMPSAQAVAQATLTVSVPGVVFLTPSATAISQASALVTSGGVSLTPTARAVASATAGLTAPSTFTAAGTGISAASAFLTASAQITPTATATAHANAAVTTSTVPQLTPVAQVVSGASVTLRVPQGLVANATAVARATCTVFYPGFIPDHTFTAVEANSMRSDLTIGGSMAYTLETGDGSAYDLQIRASAKRDLTVRASAKRDSTVSTV